MKTRHLLFIILLVLFSSQKGLAQNINAPFIARLELNGDIDRTYNNGSYSVFLNVKSDKDIRANSLLLDQTQSRFYINGYSSAPASPNIQKPLVICLDVNRLNTFFGAPNGFVEVDPLTQYFTRFENNSSFLRQDNGVVAFGAAVRSDTEFYPFSFKLTDKGHLENLYREGGTFIMLDLKNQRIRSVDHNNNFQAGIIESYIAGPTYKVFSSKFNGNDLTIGPDSVSKINDPIIKILQDDIFVAATTKTANTADVIKDGGLTLAKFDRSGKLANGFGNKGKVVIPISSGMFTPQSMTIDNNLIYVAGKVGERGIAVIRLKADGTLDESFAGDGVSIKYLVGNNIQFGDILVLPTGVYVAGSFGKTFFITKLNIDGTLDLSWQVSGTVELYDLNNWQGGSFPVDKIDQLMPFKLLVTGTGSNQKLLIAGNASVKK